MIFFAVIILTATLVAVLLCKQTPDAILTAGPDQSSLNRVELTLYEDDTYKLFHQPLDYYRLLNDSVILYREDSVFMILQRIEDGLYELNANEEYHRLRYYIYYESFHEVIKCW